MRFQHVCLEALAYTLPEEVVTSADLEERLTPLYMRLRLPEGRLELMTGIAQRRFWPAGTLPGDVSVETAEKALRHSGIDKRRFGALVHGSVCRDYLEPATACGVHRRLGLPDDCILYDISNACLGLLDGMVQVANMIELGQIEAGVVVGTESSRDVVENTIQRLNRDVSLSRDDVKAAVASLTLGSGSAAVVLAHSRLSRTGNHLLGGIARANSRYSHLCHSGRDETIGGESAALMWTDSESLLREGVCTAKAAFPDFLRAVGWQAHDIARTFCHQVGRAHQRALFNALGLDPSIDHATVAFLGNTGSVALPMTAAMGVESGCVRTGDRVALLGIGSGINVLMLGVEWGCVSGGIR